MTRKLIPFLIIAVVMLSGYARADELTAIVQQDLAALGYDPGTLDGEATVPTIVAVPKIQAEHGLEVKSAAKTPGLTESDVEAWRKP